jgi:hypothetical protein
MCERQLTVLACPALVSPNVYCCKGLHAAPLPDLNRAAAAQLYLEDTGKPGDLRVSEVYEGDPAVKGSIFVHERT